MEIDLIPEIPLTLLDAAQTGRLVPFVGAGVSRLAGLPDWDDFANKCLDSLCAASHLSVAARELLKTQAARTRLSVAKILASEFNFDLPHEKILTRPSDNQSVVYGALNKLAKKFVTTNYDRLLDTPSRTGNIWQKPQDFTLSNLLSEGECVFHLHGSIQDSVGMLISTQDYLSRYAHTTGETHTFLKALFSRKNVLFVGYGIAELEVLEYIFVHGKPVNGSTDAPSHFILQGFFQHERLLCEAMSKYFAELGVQLIPFSRDEHDYAQLVKVLEDWNAKIVPSDPLMLDRLVIMDGLLDE